MNDQLNERLGQIEESNAAMARALAAQSGQLRVVIELLRQILVAVTPDEGGREGPSLDQLMAQLIMQLREHSLLLRRILEILSGRQPAGSSTAPDTPAGSPRP